jgi:hypothetical protein
MVRTLREWTTAELFYAIKNSFALMTTVFCHNSPQLLGFQTFYDLTPPERNGFRVNAHFAARTGNPLFL